MKVGGFVAYAFTGGEPLQASGFILSIIGSVLAVLAYCVDAEERRRVVGRWDNVATYQHEDLSLKVREVIKLIEGDGWRQTPMRGSHRQFHHPTKPGTVTVAGKPSVDIPPGTLNNILKQAGLK